MGGACDAGLIDHHASQGSIVCVRGVILALLDTGRDNGGPESALARTLRGDSVRAGSVRGALVQGAWARWKPGWRKPDFAVPHASTHTPFHGPRYAPVPPPQRVAFHADPDHRHAPHPRPADHAAPLPAFLTSRTKARAFPPAPSLAPPFLLHAAPPRITALDARPPHLHGRTGANLAPELACLRGHVDDAVLAAAALRAQQIGVGADRVLIANGDMRESTYLQFFCAAYGAQYSTLKTAQREDCPLNDAQLIEAARAGILPLRNANGLCWTIAPRGVAATRLAALLDAHPGLAPRIQLASTRHFDEFILRIAHDALGEQAANGLASKRPDLSAAPQIADRSWRRKGLRTAKMLALGAVLAAIPKELIGFGGDGLACWFLGFIGLRLVASLIRRPSFPKPARVPDRELPVYTIIAALYRESESVAGLIHALQALDYPAEKLDIKIAIEADDLATRAAIEKLNPPDHIEIIIAPNIGPRTKPKALNCALNFARGSFIVVFDAEDRPEPDQLRKALDAFRQHGDDVVCAQASLCIDNGGDSWLSRMFAAEYAGQFDVFLPGFSAMRLPLPLGGSSNHFRTQALRQAGAWDAYNVTEDADLGLRLARFGFRSVMIGSTTFEEAPARFGAWLRQRTRWLKGWMQIFKKIIFLNFYNVLGIVSIQRDCTLLHNSYSSLSVPKHGFSFSLYQPTECFKPQQVRALPLPRIELGGWLFTRNALPSQSVNAMCKASPD